MGFAAPVLKRIPETTDYWQAFPHSAHATAQLQVFCARDLGWDGLL